MKKSCVLLSLLSVVLGTSASAQVLVEKQLSLELARDIATGAIEACRQNGYATAVTVVDRAGQVKVSLRDDNAGPHTIDTSRRKAYTALTFKRTTIELAKNISANPAIANLKDVSDALVLGGAVPIRAGDQIIGAVGVSGAPGGDKDESCANAGLGKVAGKLG